MRMDIRGPKNRWIDCVKDYMSKKGNMAPALCELKRKMLCQPHMKWTSTSTIFGTYYNVNFIKLESLTFPRNPVPPVMNTDFLS